MEGVHRSMAALKPQQADDNTVAGTQTNTYSTPRLTAYRVITLPLPALGCRTSPRSSISPTEATVPRTYEKLVRWEGFGALMKAVKATLDKERKLYSPIQVPGCGDSFYMPAADVSEVRAPLQNVSKLLNDVAFHSGYRFQMVGGGSGRGASGAGYYIRVRADKAVLPAKRPSPEQSGNVDRFPLSRPTAVPFEIIGDWQWPLEAGNDVTSLSEEEMEGLGDAIQQCYGYMVMEEAPLVGSRVFWLHDEAHSSIRNMLLGCVTCHNLAIMLKRDEDVENKTLYVSDVVTLDKMLLALYTLFHQAKALLPLKQKLNRSQVPITPGQSTAVYMRPPSDDGISSCSSPLNSETSYSSSSDEEDDGGSSALESRRSHEFSCMESPRGEPLTVNLFGFDLVNLTDRLVGFGRYGPVLQGAADGKDLAVKIFELKREGAVEAWYHECSIYQQIKTLQGDVVPEVCYTGMFAHTGSLFIAMTDEGSSLEHSPINSNQMQELLGVVQKLHSCDVLSGDIRLANFVSRGKKGDIKLVDFEKSELLTDKELTTKNDAWNRELEEVKALYAKAALGV